MGVELTWKDLEILRPFRNNTTAHSEHKKVAASFPSFPSPLLDLTPPDSFPDTDLSVHISPSAAC